MEKRRKFLEQFDCFVQFLYIQLLQHRKLRRHSRAGGVPNGWFQLSARSFTTSFWNEFNSIYVIVTPWFSSRTSFHVTLINMIDQSGIRVIQVLMLHILLSGFIESQLLEKICKLSLEKDI
ncbi:MAG: hypothetical protein EZS28_053036 [Streblomastix strix]|uniref:Uncharacterized protein n=1 Tax=Streblomastix strix TaxID=222440 RepID=A0A5J4RM42_9EUKA|nr:MAG: hypothetical protein EZS28_053036 [Streblomastix strix]